MQWQDLIRNRFGTSSNDRYRIGIPSREQAFEITGIDLSGLVKKEQLAGDLENATAIDYEAAPSTGVEKKLFSSVKAYYYNEDADAVLPFGQAASHALPYKTLTLAGEISKLLLHSHFPLTNVIG